MVMSDVPDFVPDPPHSQTPGMPKTKTPPFRGAALCVQGIGILVSLALLLCMTVSAEASVPGQIRDVAGSYVTVSVLDESGRTLRTGPGLVLDGNGIVLCSCGLVAKWAEKLDYSLVATTPDGSRLPITNLLSRPCQRGASYLRVNAEGLRAAALPRDPKKETKGSYYLSSPSLNPSDVRAFPLPVSPSDSFARKAAAADGLHVLLNSRGDVLAVALTESIKGRRQTQTLHAEELADRLVHLRKTAGRLAAAAKIPAPDLPPPPTPAKPLLREAMKRIEELKLLLSKTPDDPGIHIALGKEYEMAGMTVEAVDAFSEAVKRDPKSVDANVHIGVACYRMARYREAIEHLSAAAHLDSAAAGVHAKLGGIFIITGQYRHAVDALRKALSVTPDDPSLHFNLGLAYYLQGDRNGALGEYAILKRLNGQWAEKLADLMY